MCTRAHGHDSRKLYTYAEQGTLVCMCVLCTCGEGSVCLSMDSRALDDRLNYPPPLPSHPSPFPLFNLYLYLLSLSVGFRSTLSYEHSLGSIRGRNGVAVHRRAAASLPLFSIVLL